VQRKENRADATVSFRVWVFGVRIKRAGCVREQHRQHLHDGGGGVVGQQLGEEGGDDVHGGEGGGLAPDLAACRVGA